jgi:hypothetical protein
MSSIARYIASTRSKVIAKASKVQYTNSTVSTDTLINGVVPCPRISFDEIFYKAKPCCGIQKIRSLILDGGDPYASGPKIYDGGQVFSGYDGGNPSSTNLFTFDGGNSYNSGPKIYDGGSFFTGYDGGNPSSTNLFTFDGGNSYNSGPVTYNGGSV